MASKILWMVSMIIFSMVAVAAAVPKDRFKYDATCSKPAVKAVAKVEAKAGVAQVDEVLAVDAVIDCVEQAASGGSPPVDDNAGPQKDGAKIKDRIDVIKNHYKRHAEMVRYAHSCAVAVYQVSETKHDCWKSQEKTQKCLASPEAGLAYLAEQQDYHHLFDGNGVPVVDDYQLKDPTLWDYRFILEGYVEHSRCEEARLYMNLPHAGVFGKMADHDGAGMTKQNVRNYFHQKAIFENALPAILHNFKIKKLFVHRVVGFTHASWGKDDNKKYTVGLAKKKIDPTKIRSNLDRHTHNGLGDIFEQAHIMDAVEFDLVKYRKEQTIGICLRDPDHEQCHQSNTPNLENHKVPITEKGTYKRKLHFKSEGITNFLDAMICSLAKEYEISMQDPINGKGAESFRKIYDMRENFTYAERHKYKHEAYHEFVENQFSPGHFSLPDVNTNSFDYSLKAVMNADDWPQLMKSVATHVKDGMCDIATVSTYAKYVAGDVAGDPVPPPAAASAAQIAYVIPASAYVAPVAVAPQRLVYQQPVYQQPVYQPPVYQQPARSYR